MLEILGLSPEEEAIYLALLRRPPATPEELSDDLSAGFSDAAERSLETLIQRGLVRCLPGSPERYLPIEPATAFADVVANRERELQAIRELTDQLMAEYRTMAHSMHSGDLVEVVTGADAVVAHLTKAHRNARHEVCAIERPPYRYPPVEPNPLEREQLARGVRCHVLYDRTAVDIPGRSVNIREGVAAGEEARVLADLPLRLQIIDGEQAFLPLHKERMTVEGIIVVRRSSLTDALVDLFWRLWRQAVPLQLDATASKPDASRDRKLFEMLVTGMSDQAIGRELGVSERTVQRHVQSLMVQLGAKSRFQLGAQAVRQGWLL